MTETPTETLHDLLRRAGELDRDAFGYALSYSCALQHAEEVLAESEMPDRQYVDALLWQIQGWVQRRIEARPGWEWDVAYEPGDGDPYLALVVTTESRCHIANGPTPAAALLSAYLDALTAT